MTNQEKSFNLWNLLLVLARRKKFIIGFVVLATVAGVVTAFVLPKWYKAKTSILPSQYDQSLGLTGNFAQFVRSSAGFELPLMATPSDVYATMLKSQTIKRAVIEENNLVEYFDEDSRHELEIYLEDKTKIKVTGEGVVELYFEDKNPEMSAQIANSYIRQLDALNRRVKAAKARADKDFIYSRLKTTEEQLNQARRLLLDFRTKNKALDLGQQRDIALGTASELKRRLALKTVDYDVQLRVYSADHPAVLKIKDEIDQIQNQLNTIELGSNQDDTYLNLPLAEIPRLEVEAAELQAEVATQEKVYDLLLELYEEARIKEQKDTPTIAVLEEAIPPEIKAKPQRSIIAAVSFFGSLILAILIALFADYLENIRRLSPSDFELLKRTRDELTGKTGYSDS